ncbi:MAG TPA: SIMPL domain-containing protein [Aeromicrobium sp.]|nr:SIMPL domain-containing protein [Aeromicrobium sp.]
MVVDITVRGEAEARYPAERGIVTLAAAVERAEKQQAYDQAASVQQAVTAQLTELADRGAVLDWSSDQVSVYSHRPWRDNGERENPVHVARVEIIAEFSDFDRLGGFIDYWASRDGVEIAGIVWDVLDRNRRVYENELRRAAVDDALIRAQAYADALRRGRVVATRIADPGLLDSGGGPRPYALKMESAVADSGGLQLTPEPVRIHVAVDAGFTAD